MKRTNKIVMLSSPFAAHYSHTLSFCSFIHINTDAYTYLHKALNLMMNICLFIYVLQHKYAFCVNVLFVYAIVCVFVC